MKVLIVGGGVVGTHLAALLAAQGVAITIIEPRPRETLRLPPGLPAGAVVSGDGTDPAVLETAGVRQVDVVAAVTGTDATNLVVTSLARFEFGVRRTIARVNDPRNAWMFGPAMGVDVAVNQADLLAHLIAEEMSLGDMMTLLKLRKGQFALVEEKIAARSPAAGRPVGSLAWPPDCGLAAVIRHGALLIPRPDMVLEAGDEVLAVVHAQQAAQLAGLLQEAG